MMKVHKFISPLTRFVYAYPVLMLASLYTTWLLGVFAGTPPRPSLDDPKYISTLVDIPYVVTMILIIAMPSAMVLGVGLTPLHFRILGDSKGRVVAKTALSLLVLAALWAATIAVCRLDPWNVSMWYMD
jgi:hypothetical protein